MRCALLFLPLALAACKPSWLPLPSLRQGGAVAVDSVKVENAAQRLTAVVYYPNGRSLPGPVLDALRDSAESYVQAFTQDLEPVTPDMPKGYVNNLYGGVSAFYEGPHLISGRFDVTSEDAGAAHPAHWARCFLYERQTGAPVPLQDLFLEGSPYLYVLSEQVRAALRTSFALDTLSVDDEDWFLNATAPSPETFSCTSVDEEGVRVFFEPYRLGSYAFGEHEALVPWANLRRMVRPGGPADVFLKPLASP